jgi:riboflavin kinase/FMN adenylyltransferase
VDVIHYPDDPRPAAWRDPALALGNVDGMHRGHAKLIGRLARAASDRGLTPVVLTFDPHPTRIIRPDKAPPLLMTMAQKLEALERAGMHGVAVLRFTPEIARWEPETFVRSVLVDWLHVGEVWVGSNSLFGRDRSGNYTLLRLLGARLGFKAEKIDPVRYKEFVVSSTRIRRLIADGRVDEAAALLGHHYFIDGTVVHGDARGRSLGYPTANVASANELLPPHGVYATMVSLGSTIHPSITNVGVRPTFGAGLPAVIETFLFNFDRELYGSTLRLWFVQRLRDERTFASVEALRAQIAADCRRARALFERISL